MTPPIYVTQPYLPPLEEFVPYLQKIWDSKVLTNGGPFHQQLEQALCEHLGVKHLALFTNGTIALVTALQALRITGEVITTPYSFVATAHSLLWNGIKPVFVDVDPNTLNLDPAKIEAAITPQTTAIMPVHVYGHPCDVDAIQKIADNYNLRVIYDAAHAFGVQDKNGSVLNHGDLSVLSFHATKVFNTFEGGAIICPDAKTKIRIDQLKNFGHVGEVNVVAPGINGKMSEFNAALGLLQLKYVDQAILLRKQIDAAYRERLKIVKGIRCLDDAGEKVANFAYFPILVQADYAGNMGVAQGMDILLNLAHRLLVRRDIGFVFVGRGSDAQRLRDDASARGLHNVVFHDEIDPTEIPGLYAQCHIGIVALDPRHKTHNIPGKFVSYMQSGLPVLASINPGNDLVEMIEREGVGRVCTNHSVDTLQRLALELVDEVLAAGAGDQAISERCKALSAKLFSPEAAVKQIVAAFTNPAA